VAAILGHKDSQIGDESSSNYEFTILIPAHNEEFLLPDLLESLQNLDYPKTNYSVHVIADNCTDQTEIVARAFDVVVHKREDKENIGKGYALQWALDRIWQSKSLPDAVLIIDADSIVSRSFLQVMSVRLAKGEHIIQAYYTVRDPDQSWSTSLRYAAFAVLHYLRPQGRMFLGGSVGLKGNGMVFKREVIQTLKWSNSVTEDIEFHMILLLQGYRVAFAPDAVIWGEMPGSLADSQSQHTRWEKGRLDMARIYIPKLVTAFFKALRKREFRYSFQLFDAVMEHIIPPLSILASLVLMGFLASLSIFILQTAQPLGWSQFLSRLNVIISAGLILGLLVYLIIGLLLVKAPKKVYFSFAYAPILVGWKVLNYVRVLFRREQLTWVRTKRNEA
jgi:cellulose synthase/poly-beta-1,6-N-acetylglucosamine synthase-like glycosyltransferase